MLVTEDDWVAVWVELALDVIDVDAVELTDVV